MPLFCASYACRTSLLAFEELRMITGINLVSGRARIVLSAASPLMMGKFRSMSILSIRGALRCGPRLKASGEEKSRSFARFRVHPNPASVSFHDAGANCQA